MWNTLCVDQVVNHVFARVCSTVHDEVPSSKQCFDMRALHADASPPRKLATLLAHRARKAYRGMRFICCGDKRDEFESSYKRFGEGSSLLHEPDGKGCMPTRLP